VLVVRFGEDTIGVMRMGARLLQKSCQRIVKLVGIRVPLVIIVAELKLY